MKNIYIYIYIISFTSILIKPICCTCYKYFGGCVYFHVRIFLDMINIKTKPVSGARYDSCLTDFDQNQINMINTYADTMLYSSPVLDLGGEVW